MGKHCFRLRKAIDMKYIVFERQIENNMVEVIPVIFPNSLVHSEVSEAIIKVIENSHKATVVTPVTAGFVNIMSSKVYSSSETLKLASTPSDALLMQMVDYLPIQER